MEEEEEEEEGGGGQLWFSRRLKLPATESFHSAFEKVEVDGRKCAHG